ncbi:MAG: SDR family oxidoreductase [Gammaproteobacteria bacterium]|nr:SDR family oxidoreductase [Gammaproteobacteria bacterium]
MTIRPRSILITGCSSGIGYHAAHALKARGYRVFATARKTDDVARLHAEGLESLHLDLSDSASIHNAVEDILASTGGTLYGLFNNGGYGQPGAVEDLSREMLRAQFETNVFGGIELTNAIIPVMRRQGHGRIVQNSSVLGFAALPFRGAYTASKYALEGFYDTLRLELADTGIQVALIEPGPIESRFRANAYAVYQRTIDVEHSAFRDTYRAMERRLTKQGPAAPFTLGPEAVLDKLLHALESPRARPRYFVTFPTYLFGTLKRLLPTRGLDWVLRRVSRSENR